MAQIIHSPSWKPSTYPTQFGASAEQKQLMPESSKLQRPIPRTIHAVEDAEASPKDARRTLIVCLDGTGDQYDDDNSNIVSFISSLKKDDPRQVTYYQSGIGTYSGQGTLKGGFSAAIDMAIGSGLGIHIKDAYAFLMKTYKEGDKICLFGFSRGAYTVRCLAGMLHKVGLLPAHNVAQIEFAYKFYKDDTAKGWEMSAGFKKAFCNNVEVYFVGVFDCVASVGFIPRKLPFSKTPTNTIHYFRHAMALDEHRAKFKVLQWAQQDPDLDAIDNTPKGKIKRESEKLKEKMANGHKAREAEKADYQVKKLGVWQHETASQGTGKTGLKQSTTDVKEVWFAGAHADVGGGAVLNGERHVLARVPLRWMIRQCFETNTGIIFKASALAETGLDVTSLWPTYKTPRRPVVGPAPDIMDKYENSELPPLRRRSTALGLDDDGDGNFSESETLVSMFTSFDLSNPQVRKQFEAALLPEQVEDHFDAMAPINDQLVMAKGWWILEIWPVKVRVQKRKTEKWEKVVRPNLGRFRAIRGHEPKLHWTVDMRMSEQKYKIRNRMDVNAVWHLAA